MSADSLGGGSALPLRLRVWLLPWNQAHWICAAAEGRSVFDTGYPCLDRVLGMF